MRLHRFFVEEQLRNKKEVTIFDDENIHQWKDVFRLREGNQVILLDNSGFEYLCEFTMLSKSKAEFKILECTAKESSAKKEIWLLAALIKKDNYEWILEKDTEIGVSHFIPIVSERSEKKNLNMERAQKIVKEASEQSGRSTLPVVDEPVSLEIAFTNIDPKSLVVFHTEGVVFSSLARESFLDSVHGPIGILVGPEGGWTEDEMRFFKDKNIPVYSLGNQVLRAETAAIIIPSLILF